MPRSTSQPSHRAIARLIARSHRQGAAALYRDPLLFDRLYGRRSADLRCYVDLARRHGGPVLEIGVGTGRVAAALAQAGVEVVGVDVVPSMLARARQRRTALPRAVRERIDLVRADMRRLTLGRRFGLVIAPFNAFTHLYTRRDFELTLAGCRRHLRPGGRLAFDVVLPDLPALCQDPARLYRRGSIVDPQDGRRYAYAEASHYDASSQVRSVTLVLQHPDGSTARAIPLAQRQLFPAELEMLLHYNGFDLEQRFGDFAFGPLTERSETQLIVAAVARKPRRTS